MELCIDTSTRYASVAVSMDGAIAAQLSWRSARNHSVELVEALRLVMERTGAAMDDLDAVFVARGPGGFSALRVGLSFAKSLAMATGAPLVGVGTLDAEALPYLEASGPICAAIEAGRRALYVGLYGRGASGGAGEAGYRVVGWDELSTVIDDGALVCGESAAAVVGALAEQGHLRTRSVGTPPPTRSPAAIAELAYRRFTMGDVDSPEGLEPLYMRGSQVQRAQKARAASTSRS